MENFYLIDKEISISSFDIIRKLRKRLNLRKMGHTGTLDPLATGLVLVATGNYTKLIPFLEKDKKTYITTINLDGVTDSFDLAEEVHYLSEEKQEFFKNKLTRKYLENILIEKFTGIIEQTPPKFSAVKINGKRAYKLARKGEAFEIKSKKVEIINLNILNYTYPKLEIKIEVSAGTYIRSIAKDLGNILETGGYLSALRRTKIARLDTENSIKLEDFSTESFSPLNTLDVKKIFNSEYFLEVDKNGHYNNGEINKQDFIRLNNGLERLRKFNLELNKNYFLFDGERITNVVMFDGEKLIPVKKIM
ncbi:MAG: tRNA pseudouridine(55) synthase TruB [Candidatus Gracilibacteria bacterium]|nr:tRNA pseudouridine(55) synthase TruB [Candidatus Gracilibacteria bacterium]MDQ7022909.1 tRNA pseudouridine(55) synthase TruB [Candidatus Gracilibacteria bacterium]